MENLTDAKLLAIQSLLEEYQHQYLSILLTLAHMQALHNKHLNEEGLPVANERYQTGVQFFFEVISIAIR